MAPHADTGIGFMNGFSASGLSAPPEPRLGLVVDSPNTKYTNDEIRSKYIYHTTSVTQNESGLWVACPKETIYDFKTQCKVPKTGVLLVGWGGNNGSTVTAAIIANRNGLSWATREGLQCANYYGSLVMSSTIKLGTDSKTGQDVNVPFHDVLPMLHPNDLLIGGWDINCMNLADAMDRAQVLEPALKQLVRKEMSLMKPMPSIYYPDFIAANQEDRADNILEGSKACMEHVEHIRKDIRYVGYTEPSSVHVISNSGEALSKPSTASTRSSFCGRRIRSALPTSFLV